MVPLLHDCCRWVQASFFVDVLGVPPGQPSVSQVWWNNFIWWVVFPDFEFCDYFASLYGKVKFDNVGLNIDYGKNDDDIINL